MANLRRAALLAALPLAAARLSLGSGAGVGCGCVVRLIDYRLCVAGLHPEVSARAPLLEARRRIRCGACGGLVYPPGGITIRAITWTAGGAPGGEAG